ncbi:MAG: YggS family pyridoxal phosphate-dependent enzyme [Candidatus Kapabacteria bacterium]|nr:YggS family pyridoxal phosphate-dependent enzyme [Candidatus Kapabacteria bacterium]
MQSSPSESTPLHTVIQCLLDTVARCEQEIGRALGSTVIVAASKTQHINTIRSAFGSGITDFGENYVQELLQKVDSLRDIPIRWHFIGHLQRNKVKYIAPFIAMIQSVDSFALAQEISKQAAKHNRIIEILLQVHTSGEETKSGIAPDSVVEVARQCLTLPNIRLCGLMTIHAPSDNGQDIRREFRVLSHLRAEVAEKLDAAHVTELSMGMSGDYQIAIEEGATIIRPGTALFGERIYTS